MASERPLDDNENANEQTATIDIIPCIYDSQQHQYVIPEGVDPISFIIYHHGKSWTDFAKKYAKLNEYVYDQIIQAGNGVFLLDIHDYEFIYGENFRYTNVIMDGENSVSEENNLIDKKEYTTKRQEY